MWRHVKAGGASTAIAPTTAFQGNGASGTLDLASTHIGWHNDNTLQNRRPPRVRHGAGGDLLGPGGYGAM